MNEDVEYSGWMIKVSGGMPYSEGIYEDMNKAMCFQFYWNRNTTADDTLREYVAYEFSRDAVEDVVKAIHLLEESCLERDPKSMEAFKVIEKVNSTLPDWARTGWRWRLLYLRGLIDSQLASNGNKMEGRFCGMPSMNSPPSTMQMMQEAR